MNNVDLFVTCLIDVFRPGAGKAAVRVLERRGCAVKFPQGQTCCGQFSYNAGYQHEAALLARHFIATFESGGDPIVALSGSCAAMVAHSYPSLVYDDVVAEGGPVEEALGWRERANAVGARVVELSQWVGRIEEGDTATILEDSRMPIVYHLGCHMRRVLGTTGEAEHFMRSHGVDLVEPDDADQCCGFRGTYSMTEPVVSTALADAKLGAVRDRVQATGAPALTSADMGCLVHLQGRLSRQHNLMPILYLAELIDLIDQSRLTVQNIKELGGR